MRIEIEQRIRSELERTLRIEIERTLRTEIERTLRIEIERTLRTEWELRLKEVNDKLFQSEEYIKTLLIRIQELESLVQKTGGSGNTGG